MKFYLALLALVGIAESSGCTLTLGGLGNKLNLQDLKRAQNAGRPNQRASGTQFACFPVATQARQAPVPPTNVVINITPHHGAVQHSQPTQSSVHSSFFPTVDFYPWANNVPQFTSQQVTAAPVTSTTTYATNLPTQTLTTTPIVDQAVNVAPAETFVAPQPQVIQTTTQVPVVQDIQTFEPIVAPTQVQPTFTPIQIDEPVDTTQTVPVIDFNPFVYSQDTGAQNLNLTAQARPLITATYDNIQTPALEIYPTNVEPAVTTDFGTTNYDNFDFSTFNNDAAVVPDVTPIVEPVATTDIPQFNYEDFDFSSLNLDDLLAATPAE